MGFLHINISKTCSLSVFSRVTPLQYKQNTIFSRSGEGCVLVSFCRNQWKRLSLGGWWAWTPLQRETGVYYYYYHLRSIYALADTRDNSTRHVTSVFFNQWHINRFPFLEHNDFIMQRSWNTVLAQNNKLLSGKQVYEGRVEQYTLYTLLCLSVELSLVPAPPMVSDND